MKKYYVLCAGTLIAIGCFLNNGLAAEAEREEAGGSDPAAMLEQMAEFARIGPQHEHFKTKVMEVKYTRK